MVDVSELFSRPRLVPRCQSFSLVGGESFDVKDDEELDLGRMHAAVHLSGVISGSISPGSSYSLLLALCIQH